MVNLREIAPLGFLGVPRIWEKMQQSVLFRLRDTVPLQRQVYHAAMRFGRPIAERALASGGRQNGLRDRALFALLWLLCFRSLQRFLGLNRVRAAYCGGASVSPEVLLFFQTLGIPLYQIYGMTESAGVSHLQQPGHTSAGCSGLLIDGLEQRMAADGELLIRGPSVFKGYLFDPAAGAMPDLVPMKLITEFSAALAARYLNSFGSTETGLPPAPRCLFQPGTPPETLAKQQSPMCEFRLLDPEGLEVADGLAGEIAIRGPAVFSGYWNAPEANARDFLDGWFRMGDLFRRNPDTTYDFVDRAKYLIKSGRENIYPAEIERVLLVDSRISDAVIVRRKDVAWGEVPVAFVSTTEPDVGAADIEVICRRSLASYKRPKEVYFVAFDSFPRSTTGKIQRDGVEKWL